MGKQYIDRREGMRPQAAIVAALGVAALLAGCSGQADSTGGTDAATGAVDAEDLTSEIEGLDTGASRLTFTGAVTSTGAFTTAEDERYSGSVADVFRPARGTGSSARRGSNADGPYMFTIYTDAIHEDKEDDVVRAWINVVLPSGAGPGTYAIAASRDAGEDEAYASVTGDGLAWQFARNVEGTLHVDALGETLTAAWDFVAHDRSGDAVEVTGAVNGLPFSPQPEARYTLAANGETIEHSGRLSSNRDSRGRLTLLLGSGVYLELPPEFEAGTFPINARRESDGDVTVNLVDYDIDSVDGEITLELDGSQLHASYALAASGGDDVELEGTFEHLEL